jgi:hypothetical protein
MYEMEGPQPVRPACYQSPGGRGLEHHRSRCGFRGQSTGYPGLCFRQIAPVVESARL